MCCVESTKVKPTEFLHHQFRVKKSPLFSHTGIDFVDLCNQAKVWIALYTCCVTRAVHLDLVPDMTATTFLRSFKRFSAGKGLPISMISGNGHTFEVTAKEINLVFPSQEVKHCFEQRGIKWRPRAPWWGGIFERLIRSTKEYLQKILSQAKLSYEELHTG